MSAPKSSPDPKSRLGLCADCRQVRFIESSKGSQFLLCHLSQSDPSFPKYPHLPILTCSGYSRKPES